MPAFWTVPTGEWSLQFDYDRQRISVCCNGVPHAWGGYEHFADLLDSFRRYSYASGKPNCGVCGHEFYDHLEPTGLKLLKDHRFPHDSTDNCAWGGGLEGSCNCSGYRNSKLDLDKPNEGSLPLDMSNFISGVRANITEEAGAKISTLVSQIEFPITILGKEYTSVNELVAAEFKFFSNAVRCLKFLIVLVGGYILFDIGKFFLSIILLLSNGGR